MTENASGTTALTDDERRRWDVNHLIGLDRLDLVADVADDAAEPVDPTPEPVRRGTRAAHRVLLRRAGHDRRS